MAFIKKLLKKSQENRVLRLANTSLGYLLAQETSTVWAVNVSTEVGIRLSHGWDIDGCFDVAARASFKYLVAGKYGNLGSSLPDKELQSGKIVLMMQNL